MLALDKDTKSLVKFNVFWTPAAIAATVVLAALAVLATPIVFAVMQIRLPRPAKPLRDPDLPH